MAWTLKDLEEHLLIGSTLVEGSTLSEDEARAVLAGRTVSGHPVQESRELLNYRSATAWLLAEVQRVPFVSLDLVKGFHHRLMAGLTDAPGEFKRHANYTLRTDGVRHDFLRPSEVEAALQRWIDDLNHGPSEPRDGRAAELYAAFEQIHPFDDGNGRVGRIFVAYWLHWKHGVTWRFVAVDKLEHLRAMEATNVGDLAPLEAFFARSVRPEAG